MKKIIFIIALFTLVMYGCAQKPVQTVIIPPVEEIPAEKPEIKEEKKPVLYEAAEREGYTIQVGAFKNANNAAALSDTLTAKGYDAFIFADGGFYKVRFGSFQTRENALNAAIEFKNQKIIEEYYIVSPDTYSYSKRNLKGKAYVRNELVETAKKYIGVPYVWGGNTTAGIDCSGLTRAVYRLNGISIPRNSREQFKAGKKINKNKLKKGDLVFFGTGKKRNRVNHVGIYIGNDIFIHAPRKGKTVRKAPLNDKYWTNRFLGARTFL